MNYMNETFIIDSTLDDDVDESIAETYNSTAEAEQALLKRIQLKKEGKL